MAYTTIWGTGVEMGSLSVFPSPNNALTLQTSIKHTGSYAVQVNEDFGAGYYKIDFGNQTEVYAAVWFYPGDFYGNGSTLARPIVILDSSSTEIASIRFNDTSKIFDLYVAGTLQSSGTYSVTSNTWYHLQLRVLVNATTGVAQTKVNGIDDASYSGSTGSTSARYLYCYNNSSFREFILDDITVGTGGWPGDRRFDAIVPNSDTTMDWTVSTGGSGYTVIDEKPPNTTDYIYTTTSGHVAQVGLAAWTSTNKTPKCVHVWAYAAETAASGSMIRVGLESGGTEEVTPYQLNTSYQYFNHVSNENPDTALPWIPSDIDALDAKVIRSS